MADLVPLFFPFTGEFGKEKKDLFVSQILMEGLGAAPTPPSDVDSKEDIDDGQHESAEENVKAKKNKRLRKGKAKSREKKEQDSFSESKDFGEVKVRKHRPNHFVAVQITNPEIHDVAKKIQSGIQEKTKANLHHAIIEVNKFHITLMVMYLPNKEEIKKKAAESLDKCVPCILERTCGQPIILDFEGLSTFNGGRVLFASLKATEGLDHLHYMADEISKQMSNNGIISTDDPDKEFNPHLTLMKFDGHPELRKQGLKRVEASQYEPYVNEVFGAQTICSMQLCHMEKKRADGYYFVEHEVFFSNFC